MNSVGFGGKAEVSWLLAAVLATAFAVLGACAGAGGGISGTGVQTVANGTVTGFGSVVVDGVHYSAAPGATVTVEGKGAATESDLQTGMNVVLKGTFDSASGTGSYQSIEYRSDLKGPVQQVDPVAGKLVVLGQTVMVDAATVLDGVADLSALALGSVVEISGVPDVSGTVHASRVFLEKAAPLPADLVKVKGRVSSIAAGSFTIGLQQVSFTGQTVFVNLSADQLSISDLRPIEVRGTLSGGVVVATRIERLEALAGALDQERASVEGIVQGGTVASFVVSSPSGPITVAGGSAVIRDGSALSIQPGTEVEVVGSLKNGVLQATVIEVNGSNTVKLEGNVSAVNLAAKTVTLNGFTVSVTGDTILRDSSSADLRQFGLADLAVGNHVRVGGSLDTSVTPNRVVARKLERLDASDKTVTEGVSGVPAEALQ